MSKHLMIARIQWMRVGLSPNHDRVSSEPYEIHNIFSSDLSTRFTSVSSTLAGSLTVLLNLLEKLEDGDQPNWVDVGRWQWLVWSVAEQSTGAWFEHSSQRANNHESSYAYNLQSFLNITKCVLFFKIWFLDSPHPSGDWTLSRTFSTGYWLYCQGLDKSAGLRTGSGKVKQCRSRRALRLSQLQESNFASSSLTSWGPVTTA